MAELRSQEINRSWIECEQKEMRILLQGAGILGLYFRQGGLRLNLAKVAPVMDFPAPTNVEQLRRFLGMVG